MLDKYVYCALSEGFFIIGSIYNVMSLFGELVYNYIYDIVTF